ncbi:ComEA family DNA-binding protein [Desulfurivibrio sp. C05AmB]|uniref:ComEA family DNA-binding protein n=1 Tax=Desulfurivibrio sp. C05AmB TaxID=3374371 RepID=UPI00376EAD8F
MIKKIMLALCVLLFTAGTALAALNINTASQEELQALTGIGPSKAAAIIESRESAGPFASIEDLARVPGIGARTVENLSDRITVTD